MKCKILLFNTPYEAEEYVAEIRDNRIRIGEYTWEVQNYPPIQIRKRFRTERYYFVTPNSATPSYPQYIDLSTDKLDAKALGNILQLRFIVELLRPVRRGAYISEATYIGIGMLLGVVTLWVLKLFGVSLI